MLTLRDINRHFVDYWVSNHSEQRPIKNVFQYINKVVFTARKVIASQDKEIRFFKIGKESFSFFDKKEAQRIFMWLKDIADKFQELEDKFERLDDYEKTKKRVLLSMRKISYWKITITEELPFWRGLIQEIEKEEFLFQNKNSDTLLKSLTNIISAKDVLKNLSLYRN